MAPKKKEPKPITENLLVPSIKQEWPDESLFETAYEFALRYRFAIIMVNENIDFIDFFKIKPKPWIGTGGIRRVLVIWGKTPVSPTAVLSWRCGLIEVNHAVYKFLFLPKKSPESWQAWLNNKLDDWAHTAPEKEQRGMRVGELVTYNKKAATPNQFIDYDPSFLTISPTGKMADVLDQLDECKRVFREVIGSKVKERREKVHNILEKILSCSLEPNNEIRIAELKDLTKCFTQEIEKQNFLVDRNRLPKILLLGPSGVGKTLVARYLAWRTSPGPGEELSRPFKRIPMPEYLHRENDFEFDVFGYAAGAFTNANPEGKKGFLLERMGGVVFFDEFGDANPAIQAKLLAYLDDYQVTPRGWSGDPIFCPMLVVAATNRPIDEWAVHEYKKSTEDMASFFRNDLFRRFNYLIRVPSLNDRREELPFMLDIMLQLEAFNSGHSIKEIGKEAMHAFMDFDYDRGNFRDLENLVRTACRRAFRDGRDYLVKADIEDI